MLEDSQSHLSAGPHNTAAAISAPAPAEHPKTAAVRKRAAQPLPIEVVLLTTGEAARALRVSTITIHRYAAAGLIPFVKLGARDARSPRRYRASDIARFIESRLAPESAGVTE
jgi:excisionase family DNA binding protein